MFNNDNENVLESIPMNFIDMAIKSTLKNSENINSSTSSQSPSSNSVVHDEQVKPIVKTVSKSEDKFFKDASGNEYKVSNGVLYKKSWKPLTVKCRLIKSATGKEISMEGKEVQIYGWIEVQSFQDEKTDEIIDEENL